MENEVVIHVKARGDEARREFAVLRRDAKRAGEESGDNIRTGMSGKLIGVFQQFGSKLVDGLGEIGQKLPGVLGSAVGAVPPMGQALAGVLVAGLAAALGPLLAAALSAAFTVAMGGGVLAAGIALVAKNPKVTAAFTQLKNQLFDQDTQQIQDKITAAQEKFEKAKALGQAKGMISARYDIEKAKKELADATAFNKVNLSLRDLATPLVDPLVRAANTFGQTIDRLKPVIGSMFKTVAPIIDKLAPALGQFLERVMPGIQKAVERSVPLFDTLAEHLPKIGTALSSMFDDMSKHGPEMQQALNDILTVVEGLIIALGKAIGWLAHLYSAVRGFASGAITAFKNFGRAAVNSLYDILTGADKAFGWIPGIGPQLHQAASLFGEFVKQVNGKLDGIDTNIHIKLHLDVITAGVSAGQVGSSLASRLRSMGYAHGGITGAATGGLHNGLRMVGENGPELLDLPPGTRVHSNPDTQRMMTGGGGGLAPIVVKLVVDGKTLAQAMVAPLREQVRTQGAGSVQTLLGRPGVA